MLSYGIGYWLRFSSESSVEISGLPLVNLTVSLNFGWNLITGISSTVQANEVVDPNNIIIDGTLYSFADGYQPVETLEPGKGYWLRANNSGEIVILED